MKNYHLFLILKLVRLMKVHVVLKFISRRIFFIDADYDKPPMNKFLDAISKKVISIDFSK